MGRVIGWASGTQYKLRTSDGVARVTGGPDTGNPTQLPDNVSIVEVEADPAAATFVALPEPSNINLDAPVVITRFSGAGNIVVQLPVGSTAAILGYPGSYTLAAADQTATFNSDGTQWFVVSGT